ncbi:hypothetical protein LTR78_003491 [Recurvomyces mirabilis]|uniref:Cytochrome P450 n=1 Tax=Recurvomyces mirabilis TaxID=574656 RepID=A0AAE1C3M8_9PEZI|nr:hypothetical protein LTR78_003491 [Recurvomyces mirabilis]KAK5154475.1 hypothetical protein LTS14_006611 [Recurvomyces mirabilis]
MKAPAYDFMSVEPAGIFSLRDKSAHSRRRGLLSHAFSQQSLDNCLPLINDKIDLLLATIARNRDKPFDTLLRFRLLALDIVGELFLGQSFDGLKEDKPPQFLHDGDLHFIQSGLQGNLPWLHNFLSILPIQSVQSFLGSSERVAQFGNTAYKDYIKKYGRDSKRRDLLTKILASGSSMAMTDRETYVEIGNLVFAGSDTTSTTLTYMFWELARHPEWQTKIQEELRRSDEKQSLDYNRPLPVLEAVINEALRLHPAAPSSLLRVVPMGGSDIAGYTLPPGTTVSMQCYTTQRNSTAFPDPDTFNPQRWLNSDMSADAKLLFMPFSRGTRACLGRNLAMMELKGFRRRCWLDIAFLPLLTRMKRA